MDLVNCSAKRASKSCCTRENGMDSELGSCDHIYASLVECNSKGINNEEAPVNVEPVTAASTNKRNEDYPKKNAAPCSTNFKISVRQSSPVLAARKMSSEADEASPREATPRSPYRLSHDADFQCPRCGRRMEEPRLLPCLHPMCLSCVYELINRPSYVSLGGDTRDYSHTYATTISVRETCPLCDSHLPGANSSIPPPHYPLQHRLVMDTMRRKLVNRVLCDTCAAEVPAFIQCSTCLRNFCSECARQHEQQNLAEARTKHLMRPLWEATKVRRTILCPIHPIHALRFYCIACQQVTCKECMWSMQHRGHASEDAVGVGKRASVYLTTMLQRARVVLNNLLTQYDYDVFSNNAFEESQNMAKSYRYVRPILVS